MAPLTQLDGSYGPFMGVRRRHPDVHDGNVGPVLLDRVDERTGITDRGHHLDSRLDEQAGQSLSQQRGVVRDHYPHGSTASRRVPPSAPGPTESRPPSAATRSDNPCSPLPRGSTPPTP